MEDDGKNFQGKGENTNCYNWNTVKMGIMRERVEEGSIQKFKYTLPTDYVSDVRNFCKCCLQNPFSYSTSSSWWSVLFQFSSKHSICPWAHLYGGHKHQLPFILMLIAWARFWSSLLRRQPRPLTQLLTLTKASMVNLAREVLCASLKHLDFIL